MSTDNNDNSIERKIEFIIQGARTFAALSDIGSILIFITIYRTIQTNKNHLTTYNRLMLGISVYDFIFSTSLLIGPAAIPKDILPPYSYGNDITCTIQGFFIQLGFGSICYSQMLMLHYVLIIRYNIRQHILTKKIEPYMHAIPIIGYIILACIALSLDLYHPASVYCWIGAPTYCYNEEEEEDITDECIHKINQFEFFDLYINVIPVIIFLSLIIIWLFIICFTVIQRFQKSRSFLFRIHNNNNNTIILGRHNNNNNETRTASASSVIIGSSEQQQQQQQTSSRRIISTPGTNNILQDSKSRQVIVQCIMYAIWFVAVVIFGTIGHYFDFANAEFDALGKHFGLVIMQVIFFPLHGLFNFIIYIRPRYLSIRTVAPNESRWFAIREAIWFPISTRNRNNNNNNSTRISRMNRFSMNNNSSRQNVVTDNINNNSSSIEQNVNSINDGLHGKITTTTTTQKTNQVNDSTDNKTYSPMMMTTTATTFDTETGTATITTSTPELLQQQQQQQTQRYQFRNSLGLTEQDLQDFHEVAAAESSGALTLTLHDSWNKNSSDHYDDSSFLSMQQQQQNCITIMENDNSNDNG